MENVVLLILDLLNEIISISFNSIMKPLTNEFNNNKCYIVAIQRY